MKRTITTLLLSMLILLGNCVVGCSGLAAQYAGKPTEAKNSMRVERTMGGFMAEATVAADSTGTIEGLEARTKDGTEFKLPKATFETKPSQTIGSWSEPMRVYDQQLGTTWNGIVENTKANWAGVSDMVGKIAPALTGLLATQGQTAALKPQLTNELAGLMRNPSVNVAEFIDRVPPDIVEAAKAKIEAEVKAKVQAELKRLAEEAAAKSKDDAPPAEGTETHGPSAKAAKKPKSADLSSRKVVLWIFKYLPIA